MALEDMLRENTDAINRLTAVTENLMKLRVEAIDAVKDAGKTGAKPAAKKPASKGNISDNPEDRKDPAAEGETKTETKKPAAKKPAASSDADFGPLGEAIKAYVGFDDDADRRAGRAANVKKIFSHDKIKATKHTDVPEAMIDVVIANIKKLQAKAVADAAKADSDDDDLLA